MLSLFEMVGKTFVINQFVVGSGIKFWLGMFSLLFRFYSSWQLICVTNHFKNIL